MMQTKKKEKSIALEGKSKLNIESPSLQVILIAKGYF